MNAPLAKQVLYIARSGDITALVTSEVHNLPYVGAESGRLIAANTFTLVNPANYLTLEQRSRYNGTHEMLDELGRLFDIKPVAYNVHVPFKHPNTIEADVARGYGNNHEEFNRLILTAKEFAEYMKNNA